MSGLRVARALAALSVALAGPALAHAAEPADAFVRRAAAGVNPPGLLLRIGLDAGHRLMLASEAPYTIVDPARGAAAWRDTYTGETALIAEGGPEGEPPSVYRVQVGAYASRSAAEAERARLASELGVPAVTAFVPDRGSWRVRVGEADERAALAPLLAKLRAAGLAGAWIAEEPRVAATGVSIRIVDRAWDSALTRASRLVALPAPGSLLKVEGKTYRGAIELRVDAAGRLRAIDWIELESYLRGVVPSELGPDVWPEIEALKAQAVAARTYAVANRGQFADDGYDVCATPRCQAYGGASAEHPLSDAAISRTAGEIALFHGKPIDALYTATCGGRTEDAKEIFPEQEAPYLVGVPCRAEDAVLAGQRMLLRGAAPAAIRDERGPDATRDAWLLACAGVFGAPSHRFAKAMSGPVDAATLRRWTAALAALAGRPAPSGPPIEPRTLARAALAIARDLGWDRRADVLLSEADLQAIVRDPEAASLPADERRALAYLASQGAVEPGPDGRWGFDRAPSGAALALALARIGESYDAFDLDEATFARGSGRSLTLIRGKGSVSVETTAEPRLFTASGARAFPVAVLSLWPGDKVRYHRDPSGRIDFLELRPPVKGISDDRSASVYAWEVRRSASELQAAIDKRLSVGAVTDLEVLRRGASGRIVKLRVVGSSGSAVVEGFDVRNLLDLRETLTVIELQRDPRGRIVSAVFAGKGWGHGVGMCQVGAYGMALRGADYRAILEHYYSGITLGGIPATAEGTAGAP